MNAFEFDDYKVACRSLLLEKKKRYGALYSFERMARHCRTQGPYVSKVLRDEKTHFTPDQLFLACEFLKLAEDEVAYLGLLLERARSSAPERQRKLDFQLAKLKAKSLRTESAVMTDPLVAALDGDLIAHYLEVDSQLLHLALTLKTTGTSLERAAGAVGLSRDRAATLSERLVRLGLLKYVKAQPRAIKSRLHLPKDSPHYASYRLLMRLKAMERLAQSPADRGYSFSVLFSANEATRSRVQAHFLNFLKKAQKEVDACESLNGVYQMNFDLLPWFESAM